jgi:hypothetical protein
MYAVKTLVMVVAGHVRCIYRVIQEESALLWER